MTVSDILGGTYWASANTKRLRDINKIIASHHSSHKGTVFSYGRMPHGGALVCPTVGGGGSGTISITRAWENRPWVWYEVVIDSYYSDVDIARYSYNVVCKREEALAVGTFVAWLAADHAVTVLSDCAVPLDPKYWRSTDGACKVAFTKAALIVPRDRFWSTNGLSDLAGLAAVDVASFCARPERTNR